ncbi:MAG: tail fiber assembly protein [Aeromonas popoffii]|uniref:tail fiber assembly protein n=1 Tax=Aeromonas popoffii TaxID=70856 RepID=UPI003F367644
MMEIMGASAPIWANKEGTAITLQVRFSSMPDQVLPFTAQKDDSEAHGRELYFRAKAGAYGEVAPYDDSGDKAARVMMANKAKEVRMARLEAEIAPLARAARLGIITPEEVEKLKALELESVQLYRE